MGKTVLDQKLLCNLSLVMVLVLLLLNSISEDKYGRIDIRPRYPSPRSRVGNSADFVKISFFVTFWKSGHYCLFLCSLLGYVHFITANNFQTRLRGHASNKKAPEDTRACYRILPLPKLFLGKAVLLPCSYADSHAFVLWLRAHFQGQACSSSALQHECGSGKLCAASSL